MNKQVAKELVKIARTIIAKPCSSAFATPDIEKVQKLIIRLRNQKEVKKNWPAETNMQEMYTNDIKKLQKLIEALKQNNKKKILDAIESLDTAVRETLPENLQEEFGDR